MKKELEKCQQDLKECVESIIAQESEIEWLRTVSRDCGSEIKELRGLLTVREDALGAMKKKILRQRDEIATLQDRCFQQTNAEYMKRAGDLAFKTATQEFPLMHGRPMAYWVGIEDSLREAQQDALVLHERLTAKNAALTVQRDEIERLKGELATERKKNASDLSYAHARAEVQEDLLDYINRWEG